MTAAEPLTIVAGGGAIPAHVARVAAAEGRPVFIIGIDGEADASIAEFPHVRLSWGEIGRFETLLASHGARDVVLVGSITSRPEFGRLKLDFGAVRAIPEVMKLIANGDSHLLSGVIRMVEKRGYRVVGAHEIATDLVAGDGPLGRRKPDRDAARDADLALKAARAIGVLDAGQAAVVANGRVVALEAAEGTDGMLDRIAALREAGRLRWTGHAGVLAKCSKPQQDLRVDMPTIGPRTVEKAVAASLAGIAVEAGRVMIVDRSEVVARADAAGLFVLGRRVPEAGA